MAASAFIILVLVACDGALLGCQRAAPNPQATEPVDAATRLAAPSASREPDPTVADPPRNPWPPRCTPGDPLCNPPTSDLIDPMVRTGPKGNSFVGSAQVSGGTVSNADRVVAGMRAGLRACYNRGLVEDPTQRGSLRVVIHLMDNGGVADVKLDGAEGFTPTVASCIVRRVEVASFSPPEGQRVTVSFRGTLEPLQR